MRREYPENPIIGVSGIIFKQRSVLLAKRAQPPFMGQWSLPGGAVELGETLEEALKREIREETSLEIEIGGLVRIIDRIFHDERGKIQFHYVIAGYWGWPLTDQPQAASDISDVEYVDIDHIGRFQLDSETVKTIKLGWELRKAQEA